MSMTTTKARKVAREHHAMIDGCDDHRTTEAWRQLAARRRTSFANPAHFAHALAEPLCRLEGDPEDADAAALVDAVEALAREALAVLARWAAEARTEARRRNVEGWTRDLLDAVPAARLP